MTKNLETFPVSVRFPFNPPRRRFLLLGAAAALLAG